jgi:hypothetical protein
VEGAEMTNQFQHTVAGGTGEHGQFQVAAQIGNTAFQFDRLFVGVFDQSAADDPNHIFVGQQLKIPAGV